MVDDPVPVKDGFVPFHCDSSYIRKPVENKPQAMRVPGALEGTSRTAVPFRVSKAPSNKNSERMGPICFGGKLVIATIFFPMSCPGLYRSVIYCGCFQGADFRSEVDANDVRWLACRFENRSVAKANAHIPRSNSSQVNGFSM